ncbi:signal transduction histidine kinase [Bradyrhizobium sp. i1.8.4]|uniref:sensor histidine kinase n=1 Tax=unclassified Bradyrhizobium TaxID=2631580 RepID=UPI003D1C86CD
MLTNSAPSLGRIRKTPAVTTSASAAFWWVNLMQLGEFARSTTLRRTLLVAALFAGFVVMLLGFVYVKIKHDLTMRSDRMIGAQIGVFADLSPERRLHAIDEHLKQDPRRVRLAALFDPDGRKILGNLENLPRDIEPDNVVRDAVIDSRDENGSTRQAVRLIARKLPNGDVLAIGRNNDEVTEIAHVVSGAFALGVVPAVLLCFAIGVILNARARQRIVEVNERVQRIVAGKLRERLPHRNADDPFSKLTMIVNGMLDEMETLIQSLAGVGSDIAHDLRTPLTRARLILERGRSNARTLEQLQIVVDRTTEALDQSLSIITAILRLTEIEKSQRSAGFGKVALAELIREVADMYEPIAEDKGIDLLTHLPRELSVRGDRDLLIEAVANLVDNAIKYTPAGGQVEIGLFHGNRETVVRVRDTGSGINERERHAVLRRFYRSDRVRHTSGLGLGLNLVAAIVKLHDFRFTIHPGSGCVVEIGCPSLPPSLKSGARPDVSLVGDGDTRSA